MEITIEDGVNGVIEDTELNKISPGSNFGISTNIRLWEDGKGSGIFKVDLSPYAGFTVTSARFGVDVYYLSGAFDINWHDVLKEWGEGRNSTDSGECTWEEARRNFVSWTTPGCLGDGTDRTATPDGTKTLDTSSDFQIPLNNTLVQKWIDIENHGLLIEAVGTAGGNLARYRSCETTIGNKPYFYMEYTEAAALCSRARTINL